jgi:O-antigen/teichoic acid export membrane protein
MKTLTQSVINIERIKYIREWVRLISITGSAQLGIQVIGFVSGILIIRILPTSEYALYTLANTMLGTMLILSDAGISNGVMSESGKVWQNPVKFGSVIMTGFRLRRKFTFLSLLLSLPALFFLLLNQGVNWLQAVLIPIALVPSFLLSVSGSLLEIAPRLKQQIVPLQKIQLATSFGRLLLLTASLFSFPLTFVAILAAGIPQVFANRSLKKVSRTLADYTQKPDPLVEENILRVVKRVLPESIYYCLSGQLTIWLISIFGSTNVVASMGAIGRLGMVLVLFTILFNTLVLPRFARLPEIKYLLWKRYSQMQIGLILWAILVVGFFWTFSTQALWVLGSKYEHLEREVVLNTIATCLFLITGITQTLTMSRGWVINPLLYILINILSIVLGILLFDISSLQGILMLNIIVALSQVMTNVSYGFIKIKRLKSII